MIAIIVLTCIAAGVLAFHVVVNVAPHLLTPRDRGGHGREGLVIFVEPIRWLSVCWGMRPAAAGLRRAGFAGEFLYWRWHGWWRAWLVLPAIMGASLLQREAQRLGAFISERRREHPDRPIYLMGYSCGSYVALRALELLPEGVRVESAALLAPAFDPRRYLVPALEHITGPLVAASSRGDWLIAGLGTLLVGTADRVNSPSAGMVGLRSQVDNPQVVEIRWRPEMVRMGHWGGHFSATAAGFVARCVAPAMGIGTEQNGTGPVPCRPKATSL